MKAKPDPARAELERLKRALAEYPHRNTHQLQARKVCEGVLALAASDADLPPALPTPIDPRLAKVVAFLLGEGNLGGHWFGDKHPSGQAYWWRGELRKAFRP